MVKKIPAASGSQVPLLCTASQSSKRVLRPKVTLASKTTLPSTTRLANDLIFEEEEGTFQPQRPLRLRIRPRPPSPVPSLKQDEDEYFPDLSFPSNTSSY
jgi:hypothetical protein